MHPVLSEIFTKPVGWLAIGGSILMVGAGLYIWNFVRRKVAEEERALQRGEEPK